jgi:hypothetical protein
MLAQRRKYTLAGAALAAVGLILILLAAAGVFSGGSETIGNVKVFTTASTSPSSSGSKSNSQQYPFGEPSGTRDYSVPSPPGEPTLVPTIGTKTTQRLYGADPYQEAVSVTQHVWPAAVSENAPNETNNDPDRPWASRSSPPTIR